MCDREIWREGIFTSSLPVSKLLLQGQDLNKHASVDNRERTWCPTKTGCQYNFEGLPAGVSGDKISEIPCMED